MSLEKFPSFKPLQTNGEYRKEPVDCKEVFGNHDCRKKNQTGKCPTDCRHTNVCGGWAPKNRVPKMEDLSKPIKRK